jgi:hypothetical protein
MDQQKSVMRVKQCHKPPMTGNGNHTTYIFMVMTWGWWFMALFYPHCVKKPTPHFTTILVTLGL